MTTSNTLLMINGEELRQFVREILDEAMEAARNTKQPETYLDEDEVMQRLDVTHSTLWRWNKTGYLKTVKVGRKTFWKGSDITRLLEGND
ncbi:MAG: helix-turn-helix domain-containing protein [Prevotella sp.]|nr:helix-turn-helix domain-containing protein [Prevotella sp.]